MRHLSQSSFQNVPDEDVEWLWISKAYVFQEGFQGSGGGGDDDGEGNKI